jgi:hypothetical protein
MLAAAIRMRESAHLNDRVVCLPLFDSRRSVVQLVWAVRRLRVLAKDQQLSDGVPSIGSGFGLPNDLIYAVKYVADSQKEVHAYPCQGDPVRLFVGVVRIPNYVNF